MTKNRGYRPLTELEKWRQKSCHHGWDWRSYTGCWFTENDVDRRDSVFFSVEMMYTNLQLRWGGSTAIRGSLFKSLLTCWDVGYFQERNYAPLLLWPSTSLWRPFVMAVTRTAVQKTLFVSVCSELRQSQHCPPHLKIKWKGSSSGLRGLFGSYWTGSYFSDSKAATVLPTF